MRNLTGSNLDVGNCDHSCEYCSYDYQYHRDNHQYLQDISEVKTSKKTAKPSLSQTFWPFLIRNY